MDPREEMGLQKEKLTCAQERGGELLPARLDTWREPELFADVDNCSAEGGGARLLSLNSHRGEKWGDYKKGFTQHTCLLIIITVKGKSMGSRLGRPEFKSLGCDGPAPRPWAS